MNSSDLQVAENVRSLRGAMSQAKLGSLMREAGHLWSQAAVGELEAGRRRLQFVEAVTLSAIFGCTLDDLAAFEREDVENMMAWREYHAAEAALKEAEMRWQSAQAPFKRAASTA